MDAGQPLSASGVTVKIADTPFRADHEARLKLETLIADLSARFINVPADQVDTEIRDALRRIVEALDLDRSSLWQVDGRQPGSFWLTSVYEADRPIIERAPAELVSSPDWFFEDQSDKTPVPLGMDARVFYPWVCEQMLRGKTVALASLDDLPAEAARDRETFRRTDTKSTLLVPLMMGGGVIGVATFAIIRAERTWPEPLIERFQTIARLFAVALARSSADRELRAGEARLGLAAESAGAWFWELDMRTGRLWVTNAARQLHEIGPEGDLTFARFLEPVHPEDREQVREKMESRAHAGADVRFEYRVVRPDGAMAWVAAHGRFEARQALRKVERLLVVEGYVDVVRLAQSGIAYSVATLGTATTPEHLNRLFRVTSEIVFCFDGDAAGRSAAWRALENALEHARDGRQLRFLFLPEGHDPDTLVGEEGAEAFEARIAVAQPISEFLVTQLVARTDLASVDGRARLAELARPLLARVPAGVYHELLLERPAQEVMMPAGRLDELLRSRPTGARGAPGPPARAARARPARSPGRQPLLTQAILLVLHHPGAATSLPGVPAWLSGDQKGFPVLCELLETARAEPKLTTAQLVERCLPTPMNPIRMILFAMYCPLPTINRHRPPADFRPHGLCPHAGPPSRCAPLAIT